MLIRNGVDEARIRRIEGVADREPRNKDDPQAAENRRIDILIESEKQ
jgi:chemotaxis protein MotB